MVKKQIQERIKRILESDNANTREELKDECWAEALEAIANGYHLPISLARLALEAEAAVERKYQEEVHQIEAAKEAIEHAGDDENERQQDPAHTSEPIVEGHSLCIVDPAEAPTNPHSVQANGRTEAEMERELDPETILAHTLGVEC